MGLIREIREKDVPALTEICRKALVFDPINEAVIAEKTVAAPDAFKVPVEFSRMTQGADIFGCSQ
jgi:hypothetical protein